MNNDLIIREVGDFLSSDEWWNEITEFKTTNCVLFMNDVEDPPNNKEFLCFKTFLHIITNMIDCDLCNKLNIDSDNLEKILYDGFASGNHQAKVIVETLKKTTDFLTFREDMIKFNQDANDEMDEMIEELAKDEDFDEVDDNLLEKSIGRIIETSQNQTVLSNSQKLCIEMEKKLSVPVHEPPSTKKSKNPKQQQQQVFQPKEPLQSLGKLGPLNIRNEMIKRNNNKCGQGHVAFGIVKPSVIRSPHNNNPKKNSKYVLPPLSL